jgi:hypothetical protein
MITPEQIYEYFKDKTSWERQKFFDTMDRALYETDLERDRDKYQKNQERRKRQLEKQNQVGDEMKELVKPGDIVICRGTKDGIGLREVLEVDDYRITARKILLRRNGYFRDTYITTHEWNKVREIRNDIQYVG